MSPKLKQSPRVWTLAVDLGLRPNSDALADIINYCKRKVRSFVKEFSCCSLSDLLQIVAAKVDTVFVEVHTDADLEHIKQRYVKQGEYAFANLEDQLGPEVFAITFRRLARARSERQFVSVIDCRGDKAWRSYFSKWHELAHLLTLTPQMRLKFCRTHAVAEQKDPEEATMDVIAGAIGFFSDIINQHATGHLSFATINRMRGTLCPEASLQASLIGFAQNWPTPTLLVQAGLGLRKRDRIAANQGSFDFRDKPVPALRALSVTSNDAARTVGLFINRNRRVPEKSVISQVFSRTADNLEAIENLAWWEASDGSSLADCSVVVESRRIGEDTYALISLSRD